MNQSQRFKAALTYNILSPKKTYACLACFLIFGTLCGSLFAVFKNPGDTETLRAYIDSFVSGCRLAGTSASSVFAFSFFSVLKSGIIIFAAGLFCILIPLLFAVFFAKGFTMGFTVAFIIKCYGAGGGIFALLSLLPQNIFYISAAVIYGAFAAGESLKIRRLQKSGVFYKYKKSVFASAAAAFLIFLAVSSIGALLESFVLPTFIKHFCGFLL